MAAARRLTGLGAAPGFAAGPVFRLAAAAGARVSTGNPAVEAALLRAAIAGAAGEVAALAAAAEGEAADMLGFQVAMLEDPALAEAAFAAIAEGLPADVAWTAALAEEIAGYQAAEDEYFRARASDLADLRDRVLARLTGAVAAAIPPGAVVLGEDITPSRFLAADWSAGGAVVLTGGSPTAHVAMLARARGVPMVVRLAGAPDDAGCALVDGGGGAVVFDPGPAERAEFAARAEAAAADRAEADRHRLARAATADGSPVAVLLNLADPAEVEGLDPAICDGVGLVRTEFLFHGPAGLPDEETQYRAYRRIVDWAAGRPVTIRTVDAGGDKPVPGLTIDGESNPFLGVRGIRLSLLRPDIFRVQLRAICRAAAHGPVKAMLPMVAVPQELEQAAALLDGEVAALAATGIAHARPALGIMVEVPAAALTAERFAADFYSIGSNDLTQYVMAAARDIGAVAHLSDAAHPAVVELIARTAAAGRARGVEVSLCGDAAADPALVPVLLRAGLRVLSLAPRAVGAVKAAIAAARL
ncbi:MAG: phosphoenolpyruvate--protein phosphotransferase [Thalassobaculales bacterium]